MEKIKNAIDVIGRLEKKYDLPSEEIQEIKNQFQDFRVFIPLIGRFSAGKSALINNLLRWDFEVCAENIGVATALPTELCCGSKDIVCIYRPEKEFITMDEYLNIRHDLSTENAEVVNLQFSDNEVLSSFPNIALVDMPGLDSGYEVHDMAIRNYICKSMAFVLVFPADELTIPQSMEPILHDLNTFHMPMCAVITKGNRIAGEEESRKEDLRNSLAKYFDDPKIPVFVTEKETERIQEFVDFLVSMEGQAAQLGKNYYKNKLKPEFAKTVNYLTGCLKSMELSLSELEEQRDQLQDDMAKLEESVTSELEEMAAQIPKIVDEIALDVQAALSQHMEEVVYDLTHDMDPTSAIKEIARNALNASYEKRAMASIRKHLEKISDTLTLGSANHASAMTIDMDKACGKELSGASRTAIDVLAFMFGGPLIGVLAHFLTGAVNKNSGERRKEAELKAKQQLSSSVFPAVIKEVRDELEVKLKESVQEIRGTVEKDAGEQMASMKQALDEIIAKKQTEDENKAQKKLEIEGDIKILEEAEHGLE